MVPNWQRYIVTMFVVQAGPCWERGFLPKSALSVWTRSPQGPRLWEVGRSSPPWGPRYPHWQCLWRLGRTTPHGQGPLWGLGPRREAEFGTKSWPQAGPAGTTNMAIVYQCQWCRIPIVFKHICDCRHMFHCIAGLFKI